MTIRVPAPGPGLTAVSDEAIARIVAAAVCEVPGMRLARPPATRRVLGSREVKIDGRELSVELHVAAPETAPLAEALAGLVRHVVTRTEKLSGVRLHGVRVILDELLERPLAVVSVSPGRAA
jgi:hypothetical protein